MLPATNLLGIFFALTSAFVWGSGDFTGGFASRRSSPLHVLVLSALSGLVVLILAVLAWHETFSAAGGGLVLAMLGGASGALGIAALYRALSMGSAASTAPTSGVIGAVIPVVFSAVTQGLPGPSKLIGFALALAGIWLVSARAVSQHGSRQAFFLACLAGVGFGGFFLFLGLVPPGKIFTPLVVARSLTLCTGLVLVGINRLPLPDLRSNPTALFAGLLDAGGNLFYILARQYTRLDVAAVLASLYPASTVILAGLLLREKITRTQWLGVIVCLAAIALITL